MKTKLLIYSLPMLLVAMMLYGYNIQDHPNNINQTSTTEYSQTNQDYIPVTTSGITCAYTWGAQTSGTANQLLTVSAVSDQIGWAAGAGPTVRRTIDGGTTWTNATGTGITGSVFAIYAVDSSTAFCTTTPGATFIYKTTNGGTTWTQVFTQAGGFIDAIQMISATEGYAVGDPVGGTWVILKTTDGGDSWARMATEPAQVGGEAGWNNSFLIIGTNMWFGTSNTRVYHSTDLGATWSFGATTGTAPTYAVHFNDALNGLAGGNAMVKSTDGGVTYSAATSPGTAGNLDGLEGNGTEWWALRSDASVYYSTNQGTNWATAHTQAGAVFQDIDFVVVNGCAVGWAVGNGGNIASMTSGCIWEQIPTLAITNSTYNGVPDGLTCGGNFSLPNLNDVEQFTLTASDPDIGIGDIITLSVAGLPDPDCKEIEFFDQNGQPVSLPITDDATIIVTVRITRVGLPGLSCAGIIRFICTDRCDVPNEARCGIAYQNPPLPVELSSFTSTVTGNDVTLNWMTTTEANNSGFDIERSSANSSWNKVGFVEGNGNSSTIKSYSFTERALNSGSYSYRLKQIDFNGNFEYFNLSNEVNVGTPVEFSLNQNYPNPFNPSTKIEFALPKDGFVSLVIFDNSGKEVSRLVNENKSSGYHTVNFNGSDLSSGIYFYRLEVKGSDNFIQVRKMILVK